MPLAVGANLRKNVGENYARLILALPGGATPQNLLLSRGIIAENEVFKLYDMGWATKGNFPIWRKVTKNSLSLQIFFTPRHLYKTTGVSKGEKSGIRAMSGYNTLITNADDGRTNRAPLQSVSF